MFGRLHKFIGTALMILIGASPACACPWMWVVPAVVQSESKSDMSQMACCHDSPATPAQTEPAQPPIQDRSCASCPLTNPTHAVLDQSGAAHLSFHWVAMSVPLMAAPPVPGLVALRSPAIDESPPGALADLFHLHCLLTT